MMQRNTPWSLFAVVGCAMLLSYPVWRFGLSTNGDAIFHSIWYTNFARQFFSGDWYPRWLLDMNGGLGSPVFFFYPPLPYFTTLMFAPFAHGDTFGLWQLGASAALSAVASGLTIYLWLKRVTGVKPATFGAVFYMLAPYHLRIDLYSRGAFAEMWAFVWMPLLLYFIVRVEDNRRSTLVGVALSYFALIVTHLPSVVIFSAIPLAYAFWRAEPNHRWRSIGITAGGMLCGTALSAAYLLPAMTMQDTISVPDFTAEAYHERWLHFHPLDLSNLDSQLFWSVLLMTILALCAAVTCWGMLGENNKRERLFWLFVTCGSTFMMFPASGPIWSVLTTLHSIQFPWRFSAVLCLSTSALLASGLGHLSRNCSSIGLTAAAIGFVLVLAFVLFAGYTVWEDYFKGPRGDSNIVFSERVLQRRDAPEYRPATAASIQEGAFKQLLDHICKAGREIAQACIVEGSGTINVTTWQARRVALQVTSEQGVWVNVSQFYFPGWRGMVDGKELSLEPSRPDGLLHFYLPGGGHHVELSLNQRPPEIAGKLITAFALLLLTCFLFAQTKWVGQFLAGAR